MIAEPATIIAKGAATARTEWGKEELFDRATDKIILYVQTINDAQELAQMLDCAAYTSEAGDAEQKKEMIEQCFKNLEQPYIVATSALGAGFDYALVRMVISRGRATVYGRLCSRIWASRERRTEWHTRRSTPVTSTWKPSGGASRLTAKRSYATLSHRARLSSRRA